MKILSIDFEGKDFKDRKGIHTVCACLVDSVTEEGYQYWLDNEEDLIKFKKDINNYISKGYIFNAHYAYYEVTCLLTLNIDLDKCNFVDTYEIAKLLQNTDNKAIQKTLSLADLCLKYNIFNYYEDDYKDKMRKLILRNNYYTEDEKDDILEYCMHDTLNSHKLFKILCNEFEKIFNRKLDINIFTTIGNYVKAAAHVSWVGIPVDIEYLDAIKENYTDIIQKFIENSDKNVQDCYAKKGLRYTFKAEKLKEKVEKLGLHKKWKKTDSGKYATESKVLKEMRNYHPFIESLYTTQKKIQSLKYLNPRKEMQKVKELLGKDQYPIKWDNHVIHKQVFNTKGNLIKKEIVTKIQEYQLDTECILNSKGKESYSFDNILLLCKENSDKLFFKELLEDLITILACKIINKNSNELQNEDSDFSGDKETVYDVFKRR